MVVVCEWVNFEYFLSLYLHLGGTGYVYLYALAHIDDGPSPTTAISLTRKQKQNRATTTRVLFISFKHIPQKLSATLLYGMWASVMGLWLVEYRTGTCPSFAFTQRLGLLILRCAMCCHLLNVFCCRRSPTSRKITGRNMNHILILSGSLPEGIHCLYEVASNHTHTHMTYT